MTIKKTAISMEKPLFEEIDALAEEMGVSRSCLISLAAREFLQHYQNQKLLDAINAAHKDTPDIGNDMFKARLKAKHRQFVKDQW